MGVHISLYQVDIVKLYYCSFICPILPLCKVLQIWVFDYCENLKDKIDYSYIPTEITKTNNVIYFLLYY